MKPRKVTFRESLEAGGVIERNKSSLCKDMGGEGDIGCQTDLSLPEMPLESDWKRLRSPFSLNHMRNRNFYEYSGILGRRLTSVGGAVELREITV